VQDRFRKAVAASQFCVEFTNEVYASDSEMVTRNFGRAEVGAEDNTSGVHCGIPINFKLRATAETASMEGVKAPAWVG
jgi:hypothetical protein